MLRYKLSGARKQKTRTTSGTETAPQQRVGCNECLRWKSVGGASQAGLNASNPSSQRIQRKDDAACRNPGKCPEGRRGRDTRHVTVAEEGRVSSMAIAASCAEARRHARQGRCPIRRLSGVRPGYQPTLDSPPLARFGVRIAGSAGSPGSVDPRRYPRFLTCSPCPGHRLMHHVQRSAWAGSG